MKKYEKPIIEVIVINFSHIVTTSSESTPLVPNPDVDPEIGGGGWG